MGLTLQAAGMGMKAIGAYGTAQSNKSALGFQAAVDDLNAASSERSAESALAAGQFQEQNALLRSAQLKSTQRANLASSGVDLGVGSALNVLNSTDYMGQVDASTIAANAVKQAWGYRSQATNFENEAIAKRATAKGVNPWVDAATSLLGGAGNVASSWYGKGTGNISGSNGGGSNNAPLGYPGLGG